MAERQRSRRNRTREARDEPREEGGEEEQVQEAVVEQAGEATVAVAVEAEEVVADEGAAAPEAVAGLPDLSALKRASEEAAAEAKRRREEFQEAIQRYLRDEIPAGDLDELKPLLKAANADARERAETLDRTAKESFQAYATRATEAKKEMEEAIKRFMRGEATPEDLTTARDNLNRAGEDMEAARTALGLPAPRARAGGGTPRAASGDGSSGSSGGARRAKALFQGDGSSRPARSLVTNSAGELVYNMGQVAYDALIERIEDEPDLIEHFVKARTTAKGYKQLIANRERAEALVGVIDAAIDDLDDEDADERAVKRGFRLFKERLDEYVRGEQPALTTEAREGEAVDAELAKK